jgi:hypothetical protein
MFGFTPQPLDLLCCLFLSLLLALFFELQFFNYNTMFFTRDLCINRNNHQKPTFHPLGDFLNPALALLGQGLKKSPIG